MACPNTNRELRPYAPPQKQPSRKSRIGDSGKIVICMTLLLALALFVLYMYQRDYESEEPSAAPGSEAVPASRSPVVDQVLTVITSSSASVITEQPSTGSGPSEDILTGLPTLGETVESFPWKVTLVSVIEYGQLNDENGQDLPEEGKKLLTLYFNLENISEETDTFSFLSFAAYTDEEVLYPWRTLNDSADSVQLLVTVEPGETGRGCLVFQAPDGWRRLSVLGTAGWESYKPGDIAFFISHNMVTK